jgi:hypothetical protein
LTGCTKTEKESESEITMCDRMQMYNIVKHITGLEGCNKPRSLINIVVKIFF